MIAVIPIHDGVLPPGADEAVAECGGRCLLVGSSVAAAADSLTGVASLVSLAEVGDFAPLAWATALMPALADGQVVVVPGSADGYGLAPHLAIALGIDLVAGAVSATSGQATVVQGQQEFDVSFDRAVVVLTPGVRSVPIVHSKPTITELAVDAPADSRDARLVELLPADPATLALATAPRIIAGGAGLRDRANLELLRSTGLRIGASLGATRVLTDAGWLEHARQIGTTGVEIDPDLYIAVGISGAVQHIMGIGTPNHIISVNTDATCPMMTRADLALVTDGPAFVAELAKALGTTESEDA